MPLGDPLVGGGQPVGWRGVRTERGVDCLERHLRVADHRKGALLVGIPGRRVDAHEPDVGIAEDRPRPGREVLEPGPDGDDHIGLFRDGIGGPRARHPERPRVVRVVMRERRLARDRLDDRDPVPLRERAERVDGARVVDAATGDEQRSLGPADQRGRRLDVARIGARPPDVVDGWFEESGREVVRLGLDVLGQREERRSARRRIQHHGQGLRQRADDLGGLGDAVPVAAHRPERIGDGDRRVAEVFDLLQDGVDDPVLERVARQEQDREPVGVSDGRGGHHVGRARPDRRRRDHDPPAAHRLGVRDGRQGHRLLVVAAVRRQSVLDGFERLAERGDVAVAEDREDPGEDRHLVTVDLGSLGEQPAHDRLGGGQPDRRHGVVILARGRGGSSSRPGGTARGTS